MYTILLFAVIGAIVSVIVTIKSNGFDWSDFDDYIINGLTSLVGILIGGVVGLIVAICLPMTYITERNEVELVSIQDNNGVNGNFFLGCGQVESRMKYVFYYKKDDSTFVMEQHDFSDCYIKYTDGEPKEVITWHHANNSIQNEFALDISGEWVEYLFEIPKGSIKNNFQLDAQ